jgi:hypothetical protein
VGKNIQIVAFIQDLENIDKKDIIVCFDLSLQNELRRKKIKFLGSLDLLNTNDYQKIIDLSGKIRKNFLNNLSEINGIKYSNTLNNLFSFHIRYYVNCLTIQLLITKNIIKKYKPKIVRISTSSNKELIIKDNIIFSFLLKDFLKKNNIQLISKVQVKKTDKKGRLFFVKSIVHYMLNYFTFIVNSIFYNNKKTILILSTDYGLDLLAKKITKKYKNYSVIFLQYSNILSLGKIFFNRIFYYQFKIKNTNEINRNKIRLFYKNEIIKNKKIFKFQDFNFSKEILDYFKLILEKKIFTLDKKNKSADSYFSKNKPKLIISHCAFEMGRFLAEFSDKYKIPSIVISHGTHTQHKDKRINSEWKESARYLMNPSKDSFKFISAQSPLINEFLLKNNYASKIIKTGPVIFSHKVENSLRDNSTKHLPKKIILHASTPKVFSGFKPITFESTEEYIKQINSIISVIDKIKNFHLIIKFRPMSNLSNNVVLSYETFKKSLINSKNYTISVKENLSSLLNASDCLISYSSTVIEEMLNYKKPVILFDSFKRYCHVPHKIVKNNLEFKFAPINYLTNTSQLQKSLKSLKGINMNKFQKNKFWSQFIYPVDSNMSWMENIKF